MEKKTFRRCDDDNDELVCNCTDESQCHFKPQDTPPLGAEGEIDDPGPYKDPKTGQYPFWYSVWLNKLDKWQYWYNDENGLNQHSAQFDTKELAEIDYIQRFGLLVGPPPPKEIGKSLEECKQIIAEKYGYTNWAHLRILEYHNTKYGKQEIGDEAAELYASQRQPESELIDALKSFLMDCYNPNITPNFHKFHQGKFEGMLHRYGIELPQPPKA